LGNCGFGIQFLGERRKDEGPIRYSTLAQLNTAISITNITEPPRDRKKEKNIQHTGNIPLDQIYDVCLHFLIILPLSHKTISIPQDMS
jgi:hypothetical protein